MKTLFGGYFGRTGLFLTLSETVEAIIELIMLPIPLYVFESTDASPLSFFGAVTKGSYISVGL